MLELSREIGDRKNEALALNNLGGVYAHLGDYWRAFEYHQSSLKIRTAIRDRIGEANSLKHLAMTYGHLGDYKQSITYHERCFALQISLGDKKRCSTFSAIISHTLLQHWQLREILRLL